MSLYHQDDWLTLYQGDCRQVLSSMPEKIVQTVVTSPPYWGLRDYGHGDQLGLEATPEEYVANMVAVFREVRRVLRDDGTIWLNLGDTYASDVKGTGGVSEKQLSNAGSRYELRRLKHGVKTKDLVGIPWRVAFALQADGWYLRSDIIWAKPNPMPESVTDRPTKAHEYVFLLTKEPRYYYDADAIREPHTESTLTRVEYGLKHPHPADVGVGIPPVDVERMGERFANPAGRNARTVWTIATQPYPGAHFATMPEALVEPCIKAGSSEFGQCSECGLPYERDIDHKPMVIKRSERTHEKGQTRSSGTMIDPGHRRTIGWSARCSCDKSAEPQIVLDPFGGSGTVAQVANRLNRRAILIDLNPDYIEQQIKRASAMPLGLA